MKKFWLFIGCFLALAGVFAGVLAFHSLPANAAQPAAATIADQRVVIVHYANREALERAASRLDIWEVDADQQTFVALVSAAESDWLANQSDYSLQIDQERTARLNAPPGYPCYRTISTLYSDIQQRAQSFPNLVELRDIGNSYEGRDLWVVRVTNEAVGGSKPRFFLMANVHGREMITPETAMVFLDYLLQNYNQDPDVTWLLDWHEVHILISGNPDGHVRNEASEAYWRKNVKPYGSCSPSDIGVDLNRNYAFKWGLDDSGSSPDPCDETYRGPFRASELETQAVQNYVLSIFPDQRGSADTDPAPANTTGVLITLHSYSNLVLWPWGWTSTPSPNSAGMKMLGEKLAAYNNYTPQQSDVLYSTNGSTDDWSYGELGIPSYTFEMGTSGDNFFPSCSRYDAIIQPNIPALFYAAKVSRTPYITSFGPDALNVAATPEIVLAGQFVTLDAAINDTDNGNQNVKAAEYYIDLPPWAGGAPIAMPARDGAFNSPSELTRATVNTTGLHTGRHMIYVRGQDAGGNWGPVSAVFLWVNNSGKLKGQVHNAANLAPIASANIDLTGPDGPFQAVTDSTGYYQIDLGSGGYTATVSAFGYYSQTIPNILVSTGLTTTQNFTLTAIPTGTVSGGVFELGSNLPLAAVITINGAPVSANTNPTTGEYSLVLPLGSYHINASAPGHTSRTIANVTVAAGQTVAEVNFKLPQAACTLIVDDDYYRADRPYDYQNYYTSALQNAGYIYDAWDVHTMGAPTLSNLQDYPLVLWQTGDAPYNTLDLSNQNLLQSYLGDGGNLLLSGQNIAQDITNDPSQFLQDVLHADYLGTHVDLASVFGGGPFSGQSYTLQGAEGANNQNSPDYFQALPGATPVFTYTASSHTGALSIDHDNYRLLFFGFGIESISPATDRQALLHTSLDWLGCEPALVDLSVNLQGSSAGPLGIGDTLVYTLTLTNSSAIPLTGLVISDTLPAELDFVSASNGGAFADGKVRWSGLSITAEGSLQVTIQAKVKMDLPAGTWIIRNHDFSAFALQHPTPVQGAQDIETEVIVEEPPQPQYFYAYIPYIYKPAP